MVNMRRRLLGITTLAVASIMAMSGTAVAAQPTTTFFTFAGGSGGAIEGYVQVCPQGNGDCIEEGSVKVKLFKRKDGVWVKIATKQAIDEGENTQGLWYVRFTGVPRSGKCKMVANFSGTEQQDPSRGSIKGGCADSDWRD